MYDHNLDNIPSKEHTDDNMMIIDDMYLSIDGIIDIPVTGMYDDIT
jgi:hypothetical protein